MPSTFDYLHELTTGNEPTYRAGLVVAWAGRERVEILWEDAPDAATVLEEWLRTGGEPIAKALKYRDGSGWLGAVPLDRYKGTPWIDRFLLLLVERINARHGGSAA
jgi:hypothetical protein